MRPESGLLTVVMLSLGLFLHFVPRFRKRSLYFGVTVAEEFRESEAGRAIARDFRILTWAGTLVAVIVAQVAFGEQHILLGSLAPDLQIGVAVVGWILAWRRTRTHASRPTGVRTADLVARPAVSAGLLIGLVLPLAGPVCTAAYLWSKYPELPERYPVHWNATGHADRWAAKTPMTVLATPLISVTVLLLILAVALAICFGSRRGSSGEQSGWASKFRRLNLALLTTIMWLTSGLTSAASAAPLLPDSTLGWLMPVFGGALLLAIVAFAVPLIRMSTEPTGGSDATPDACWKGGAIYYNPDDPALMVERRDGIGYTINFGNRLSWLLVAPILLLVILTVAMASCLK